MSPAGTERPWDTAGCANPDDVTAQARRCFEHVLDALGGLRADEAGRVDLIVEVAHAKHLRAVREVRSLILRDQRFGFVSNRISRLPAGEFVRATLQLVPPPARSDSSR